MMRPQNAPSIVSIRGRSGSNPLLSSPSCAFPQGVINLLSDHCLKVCQSTSSPVRLVFCSSLSHEKPSEDDDVRFLAHGIIDLVVQPQSITDSISFGLAKYLISCLPVFAMSSEALLLPALSTNSRNGIKVLVCVRRRFVQNISIVSQLRHTQLAKLLVVPEWLYEFNDDLRDQWRDYILMTREARDEGIHLRDPLISKQHSKNDEMDGNVDAYTKAEAHHVPQEVYSDFFLTSRDSVLDIDIAPDSFKEAETVIFVVVLSFLDRCLQRLSVVCSPGSYMIGDLKKFIAMKLRDQLGVNTPLQLFLQRENVGNGDDRAESVFLSHDSHRLLQYMSPLRMVLNAAEHAINGAISVLHVVVDEFASLITADDGRRDDAVDIWHFATVVNDSFVPLTPLHSPSEVIRTQMNDSPNVDINSQEIISKQVIPSDLLFKESASSEVNLQLSKSPLLKHQFRLSRSSSVENDKMWLVQTSQQLERVADEDSLPLSPPKPWQPSFNVPSTILPSRNKKNIVVNSPVIVASNTSGDAKIVNQAERLVEDTPPKNQNVNLSSATSPAPEARRHRYQHRRQRRHRKDPKVNNDTHSEINPESNVFVVPSKTSPTLSRDSWIDQQRRKLIHQLQFEKSLEERQASLDRVMTQLQSLKQVSNTTTLTVPLYFLNSIVGQEQLLNEVNCRIKEASLTLNAFGRP